jgi:hypothetical protein
MARHSLAHRRPNMNVGVSECLAGKLLEKLMSEVRRLLTAKPSLSHCGQF